jgi:hypothetical protein
MTKLAAGFALTVVAFSGAAAANPPERTPGSRAPDARAQSGAAAATDARVYTAQLRRCESLTASKKRACVDAARR